MTVWVGACRQDKQQQAEVAEQLQQQCDWLEDNLDAAGPFFMGTEFSLVVRMNPVLCMTADVQEN
jgi:glutathione S-transferase